jgi:hypothetical protein
MPTVMDQTSLLDMLAEQAPPPATHCQRWRARKQKMKAAHAGNLFTGRGYEVKVIDDDTTASAYVLAHHYSGSYPSALRRFGLYRGGDLVGVAVYSYPTNVRVLTNAFPELLPGVQSMELGRLVLDHDVPAMGETWMLARCHRILLDSGVVGIVSHADPHPRRDAAGRLITPGHVGTIYQASNALYSGKTGRRTLWLLPDGTVFSEDAKSKIRKQDRGHEYAERILVTHGATPMRAGDDPRTWLGAARRAARVRTVTHRGCHRFLLPLGESRRARNDVKVGYPAVRPYPKTRETHELLAA